MKYIRDKAFLIIVLIITQLFFSAIFLSNDYILLESRMLYYRQFTINEKYKSDFIHATIENDNFSGSTQIDEFVRHNKSNSSTSVIYHEFFENETIVPKIISEKGERYSTNSKVLYNPFRSELNSKYFESFRLRQVFQDVDSRIIPAGYDFTVQIDNDLAEHILHINGINDDLNYFKINPFEIKLDFGTRSFVGLISNIFYIENTEPISLALKKYNGSFNLIVPTQQMKNSLNQKTHFDFKNSSLRIIKEMKKMSLIEGFHFSFQDDNGESDFLTKTMDIILSGGKINLVKLIVFSVLFLIYLGLSVYISVKLLKNYNLHYYTLLFIIFISTIFFSIFMFLTKSLFFNLSLYNLNNIYSGIMTTLIFIVFFTITVLKYFARKNENG